MEPNQTPQPIPVSTPAPVTPVTTTCSVCHQPILPQYYFCPNCGAKINTAPLSTSIGTQLGMYAFSIILPMMGFIFVTRWPGMKYFKSHDSKTKMIGEVAWTLLILSTIITIWLAYVWTEETIQSSVSSINASLNGYQ